MNKTQAFTAFKLIMRCLFWLMHQINGIGIKDIEDDFFRFIKDES